MGCFARTCGITNTGILENDRVLLIEFNNVEETSFYNLLQDCEDYLRHKDERKNRFKNPIKDAHIGTYDDYGSIKEVDVEQLTVGNGLDNIMIHYWAVEFLMGEVKTDVEFIVDLFRKLYFLRKSPLNTDIIGQQHPDSIECRNQIKLNIETNKFLRKRIKEFKK
jgi:hypothetical protein